MKIAKVSSIFFAVVALSFSSVAENVSKIEYVGCKRIESETIESYLPIQIGDDCDDNSINEALKALNKTGFFEEVNISMKGSTLVVSVKEFPIINKISFEGNSKLSDKDIAKAIKLKTRETLSPAKIKEIQQGLLETYRKMGRYNASVNPKVIKLQNNRVNLVFEINEGDSAGIDRIVFVGNNSVSSSDLREVIYSKVKRWYRFFVTDDIYDADRLDEDRTAIVKYYHENGYADARVISAVAELSSNKKSFTLTFTVDEGRQYTFGDVSVKSNINKLPSKDLGNNIYCRSGEKFNESLVELDLAEISKNVGKKGFSSVKVVPLLQKDHARGIVNLLYEVTEGDKVYVSKIIIKGNTKTRDHIIRREIPIEEGDAYNHALVNITETNLRNLGFFQKVEVQAIPDPTSPDKCVLQVSVEETSTAEAMASMSYSTVDGIGVDLTYNEKNFFGTGKSLGVFLGSSRAKSGKSRVVEDNGRVKKVSKKEKFRILNNVHVWASDPHVFNKDMEGSISGYRYVTTKWDSFDIKELGGSVGISYDLSSRFTQSWEYEAANRKFDEVSYTASPIIKYQTMKKNRSAPGGIDREKTGRCGISSLKHTISYGKQFMRGFKGRLSVGLSTTYAGLGGDARHLKNELFGSYTLPLTRKSNIKFAISTGLLTKGGGKNINIADSFQLGLDSFRGFEYSGFGPFSSTLRNINGKKFSRRDYIGAKKYWKGTVEYSFPVGLPEELQFRGFVFSDFGTLWQAPDEGRKYIKKRPGFVTDASGSRFKACRCDFDPTVIGHKVLDSKKLRTSLGLGVAFVTPFGPMKLTYAVPVRKEKYDEPYRFLIGFSTTF